MGSAPQNPSQNSEKLEIGAKSYNIEFNDSVLSTQGWSNPRYNGSKTTTQRLNQYNDGDTTYGKTTAIQQYSRNIYIGDYIASCSGSDDPNLVPFADFSYLMTTKYITINEDDSVEEKRFRSSIPDEKNGFYRPFLYDFTPGTKCQIILLNENVNNSLDDQYEIFFNEGRLKALTYYRVDIFDGTYQNDPYYQAGTQIEGGLFKSLPGTLFALDEDLDGEAKIYNNTELKSTYTGSNIGSILTESSSILNGVYNSIGEKVRNSVDERYFVTLITGSNLTPQINSSLTKNEALKTIEITEYVSDLKIFRVMKKYNYPEDMSKISYYTSKLNSTIPSLLVNLDKNEVLPNGLVPGQEVGGSFVADPGSLQGPKFVVLPENIHPYIKENIKYFLTKAGLIVTSETLTINPKNRQLS